MKIKELLSKSYVKQIMMFLSVFIFAQIIIIFGIIYSFQHSVNQQQVERADNMIVTLDETITRCVAQAESDLQYLLAMNIDSRILSGSRENARVIVSNGMVKILNTFVGSTKATDAYVVYNSVNDIFLASRSSRVSYSELNVLRDYAQNLAEGTDAENLGWHIVTLDGKDFLLRFYCYYDCFYISAFHIETFFTETFYDTLLESGSCILLTNADGKVLASGGDEGLRQGLSSLEELPGNFSVNTKDLSYGDLQASFVTENRLSISTDALSVFIVAMCLSSLVLLFVFLRYLSREILNPIDELSDTTHVIKQGDYTRRAHLTCSSTELQELAESINSMIGTIINQRIASYENALKQKNLELKYLQMQLRPHHFLNALSTISSMTYLGDTQRIRQFVELYSRDARYLFSVSVKAVPLEDEIRHVQDYIECQNILYPDCVFSFIQIQPEANGWLVPQMMLHALVENIYKHAVSLDSFTSFFIRASLETRNDEQMLEIVVEDDGVGFPEEVMERVNHSGGEFVESSHVGLMNISHTLFLMYGKTDLMHLSNKADRGSLIRIFIPKDQKTTANGMMPEMGGRKDDDTAC